MDTFYALLTLRKHLSSNIPTKMMKEFVDLFTISLTENFNTCLNKEEFLEILKMQKLPQFIRKRICSTKTTTRELVF